MVSGARGAAAERNTMTGASLHDCPCGFSTTNARLAVKHDRSCSQPARLGPPPQAKPKATRVTLPFQGFKRQENGELAMVWGQWPLPAEGGAEP